MKILITGHKGQLGQALVSSIPNSIEVLTPEKDELNLLNYDQCKNYIKEMNPNWIINCAAFTNVDGAERDRDSAFKINYLAPKAFSEALSETGGKLLQLSTDFVFDGNQKFPYMTDQTKNPINFYGYTKALAEDNIIKTFGSQKKYLIISTSASCNCSKIGTVSPSWGKPAVK